MKVMPDQLEHQRGAKKRFRRVRRFWLTNPVGWSRAVFDYFKAPSRDIIKLRRARAVLRFINRRLKKEKPGEQKKWWRARRKAWNERVARLEKRVANRAAKEYKVIPRSEWNAKPPRLATKQTNYSEGWFAHHSVAGNPSTRTGEEAEMRNLQQIAFSRGFRDISYPYVVFDSGRVYEGCIEGNIGTHTYNYNSRATAVCWAGNKEVQPVTDASIQSVKRLIESRESVVGSKRIRPHRSVYPTACPGRNVVAILDRV
jgi:hypothetical protein